MDETLEQLQREVKRLKAALDIKNDTISDEVRKSNSLTMKLRADDRLILELITFLSRIRDGDVRM